MFLNKKIYLGGTIIVETTEGCKMLTAQQKAIVAHWARIAMFWGSLAFVAAFVLGLVK